MEFRVGTFNILNTSCRYEERKVLIEETIRSMDCDILGLQEINYKVNPELFDLETYQLCFVPLPKPQLDEEPEYRVDGNALLIKKSWEVLQEQRIVFTNNEVAQILKLRKKNCELLMVNTHLDHLSELVRETQVRELIDYLKTLTFDACIITGDFNFLPDTRAYAMMAQEFTSVCFKVHGKEPQITFPTGLLGSFADIDEHGCYDYIWCRGKAVPLKCEVFRDCGRKTLWASDHYPIYSDIQISNR